MADLLTIPDDLDQYKIDWACAQSDERLREEIPDLSPGERRLGMIPAESTPDSLRKLLVGPPRRPAIAKMVGNRVIPFTAIDRRLEGLDQDLDGQLLAARRTKASVLAREFEVSVADFAEYNNVHDELPRDRLERDEPPTRKGAIAADILKRASKCLVDDRRDLDFKFVEFEVPPARTRNRAHYRGQPDDKRQGNAKFPTVDVLLANACDRLPILGEIKVDRDKTPFAALLQLLQYAAQTCTDPQLIRLMRSYRKGQFRIPKVGPRMDLYVLLFDFPETGKTAQLEEPAHRLAAGLVKERRFNRTIRRIVFLKGTLRGGAKFTVDDDVFEGP